MLISKKLIFVHYPRTGGTSIQHYLRKTLPDRYYPMDDPKLSREKKLWITHQGLPAAWNYAHQLGLDPRKIPSLVCIRNPYAQMLSGYLYLAQKWGDQVGDLEDTFLDYLKNLKAKTPPAQAHRWEHATYGQYTDFLMLNGQTPTNLTIGRTETLERDVMRFLKKQLRVKPRLKLPHVNASKHNAVGEYYGPEEEQLVYEQWKQVFDNGLYQRYASLDQQRLTGKSSSTD